MITLRGNRFTTASELREFLGRTPDALPELTQQLDPVLRAEVDQLASSAAENATREQLTLLMSHADEIIRASDTAQAQATRASTLGYEVSPAGRTAAVADAAPAGLVAKLRERIAAGQGIDGLATNVPVPE